MDLCAIGARIKAAREKAGMTQEDLAAALEMSPTHISVIERGVKAPKLETLVNIANTLKVSSDILLQDVVTYSSDGMKLLPWHWKQAVRWSWIRFAAIWKLSLAAGPNTHPVRLGNWSGLWACLR